MKLRISRIFSPRIYAVSSIYLVISLSYKSWRRSISLYQFEDTMILKIRQIFEYESSRLNHGVNTIKDIFEKYTFEFHFWKDFWNSLSFFILSNQIQMILTNLLSYVVLIFRPHNFIPLQIQYEEIGNQRFSQIRRRLIYRFRYNDKDVKFKASVIEYQLSPSSALNMIRNLWYDSFFNFCIMFLSIIIVSII